MAERERPERNDRTPGHRRRDQGWRPGSREPRRGNWQQHPRPDGRPRRDRDQAQERESWRQAQQPRRAEGSQDTPRRGALPRPSGGRPRAFEHHPRHAPPPGFRPARAAARPEISEFIGEGEELIAGRRPVEEAFAARRRAHRLLVVPERRAALDALVVHATTMRLAVVEVEGGTLTALAGFDGHQGVALVVEPRPAATLDEILAFARERSQPPFVLALDSLEDPQNFGTLLRSAEASGVHGVIYPTRRAAPLSPAAIKAAAGATEHLLLAAVEDLPGTLADLHAHGVRVVAAQQDAALDYLEADLRGPVAIVVGSEGRGISGPVRRRVDLSVRIPMRGHVASLNAAVAGSILLFAASADRVAARGEARLATSAGTAAAQVDPGVNGAAEPPDASPPGEGQR